MTWVQKIQVIKAPYLLRFFLSKRCIENKICTLYVKKSFIQICNICIYVWMITYSSYKVKFGRKTSFYWKLDMNCNLSMLSFREARWLIRLSIKYSRVEFNKNFIFKCMMFGIKLLWCLYFLGYILKIDINICLMCSKFAIIVTWCNAYKVNSTDLSTYLYPYKINYIILVYENTTILNLEGHMTFKRTYIFKYHLILSTNA